MSTIARLRVRKCHRTSQGYGWLGTTSEQWSSRSNCNPKLVRWFAFPALDSRSSSGTMKRARFWSAMPPESAPAGWTNCHCKPCWMKSLDYRWIRSCFTYRCGAMGLGSPSRLLRWPGNSPKLPECRSTVSPDPNLNRDSSAELCRIFRRSAARPPHSRPAYSLGRRRRCYCRPIREPVHCSLTGLHSKNGMSPRVEFLGKPRCYIGTRACGSSTPG